MTVWLQSEVPFGQGKESVVQEALWQCVLADTAGSTIDPQAALFTRAEDYQKTVLLLSPSAAKFARFLPGTWAASEDYADHRWGTLYSSGVRPEDLGLTPISG